MIPEATIAFTTHDRRDLLRRSIISAQRQSVPVEIIVMDDGSEDGTSAMMGQEFPDAPYCRSERCRRPCFHRNRGVTPRDNEAIANLAGHDELRHSMAEHAGRRAASFDLAAYGRKLVNALDTAGSVAW
jgi:hypothetical protein